VRESSEICGSLGAVAQASGKPRQRKARKRQERGVFDPLSRVLIDWITAQQKEKGWTLTELAERTGIAQSSISEMYYGDRAVNGDHWVKFLAAFGVDMRRAFLKVADFMEDQAAAAATSNYEDDGKYARKRKDEGTVSDKPPTTRPTR
jgi:transcriptional regulator with XRE-family HTH domain